MEQPPGKGREQLPEEPPASPMELRVLHAALRQSMGGKNRSYPIADDHKIVRLEAVVADSHYGKKRIVTVHIFAHDPETSTIKAERLRLIRDKTDRMTVYYAPPRPYSGQTWEQLLLEAQEQPLPPIPPVPQETQISSAFLANMVYGRPTDSISSARCRELTDMAESWGQP